MKKESDSMKERGEWIDKVSKQIQKRTFDMLDKKVEQNQWEYWENQFIPIQKNSIEEIFQEVFVENEQKELVDKFPNIFDEIFTRVFKGLKEELANYGYKLGYTKRKESFGIGAVTSELIELGEKNGWTQKIKNFFVKSEVKDVSSSEDSQESKELKLIEEKDENENAEDAEEQEEEYAEIEEEMEED